MAVGVRQKRRWFCLVNEAVNRQGRYIKMKFLALHRLAHLRATGPPRSAIPMQHLHAGILVVSTRLIFGACAMALGQFATDAASQSPADMHSIGQELESLRATQAGMREELREIKALLQKVNNAAASAAGPSAGMELALEGAHVKGASQARVVFVEYSDFQCPFCASYAAATYPQINRDYVDTGRVRYAFVNFPIESLHPLAYKEHVAAACAADEGRFWEMHDRLFANPKAADPKALAAHAQAIGLNAAKFRSCLEGDGHAAEIRQAMKTGNGLGVSGTPTFVIGVVGSDEKLKVAKVISGAKPYAVFKDAIDSVLATTVASNEDLRPVRVAVTPSGSGAVTK
jgi:protein-disulfide isomerase